jgi:hypothetical protein
MLASSDGSSGICAVDINRTVIASASAKVAKLVRPRQRGQDAPLWDDVPHRSLELIRRLGQQPIRAQHLLRHQHFQQELGLEHLSGCLKPVAQLRQ